MTLTPTAGDAAGALRALIAGTVTEPADPEYDAARRVWNGMIDRHPAAHRRAAPGPPTWSTAIRFARDHDLPCPSAGAATTWPALAVSTDGLMIDLSPMHGIRVDPCAAPPRSQGGVTWGELDAETQPLRAGDAGRRLDDTGIAGLTLGGGLGWLRRRSRPEPSTTCLGRGRARRRAVRPDERGPSTPTCSGVCVAAAATSGW